MAYTREEMTSLLEGFTADYEKLEHEMQKGVVGQTEAIRTVLAALILGGHVLVEGLPGTGKTHLGTTLAEILTMQMSRIQCTPDLMPTDIIGTYVIMETAQGRRAFEFQKGPLFANLVLVDQINRTTPRTQAAMLEAMEQDAITVSTEVFSLPRPFTLLATQNPLEQEGTYPLPEAQVDRFLFQTRTLMPTLEEMSLILQRSTGSQVPVLRRVVDSARVLKMREIVRNVTLPENLATMVVGWMQLSQPTTAKAPSLVKEYLRYGLGPRGVQAMVLGAKFFAAVAGRKDVQKEDLLQAAYPAMRHRLFLNFNGVAEGISKETIIDTIVKS
ncbi:MAG: MoxR family ATPase [Planctomycetia bacterium]|nr:MoxR family ATPase [Planctomycetia bacterium]